MIIKNFAGKKIIIRSLSKNDLKFPNKFQNFINSLVEEDVQINMNKKKSLKEESEWLKEQLKKVKKYKSVFLVAEHDNRIIGSTGIDLGRGRQEHLGIFGIGVKKEFRGLGLGAYLLNKIIGLAKKELRPKLKIIRLSVFSTNKIAIALYEKYGFKKAATIPKQIEYRGKLIDEIVMLLYLK